MLTKLTERHCMNQESARTIRNVDKTAATAVVDTTDEGFAL
jgi:hypothetical protein